VECPARLSQIRISRNGRRASVGRCPNTTSLDLVPYGVNDSYVPHASPLPVPEVAAYLAPFRFLFRYRPSWASVER
jgi:hypothetical protein